VRRIVIVNDYNNIIIGKVLNEIYAYDTPSNSNKMPLTGSNITNRQRCDNIVHMVLLTFFPCIPTYVAHIVGTSVGKLINNVQAQLR
jgi:hypothetical protein